MRISRILPAVFYVGACLVAVNAALGQNLSREIVTLGHGVLNSKASILVLEIAVVGAGPTAEDAKVRSAGKTEALIADFRRFGIKQDDWERRLAVARRPIPDEPKRVAFWTTTTLIVRLDDFAAGPEMLDRATMLGVASIRFRFESSDPQAEYEKTLKRALADARFKAEALAAEAGVKLGLLAGCEEFEVSHEAGSPPNVPAGTGGETSPGRDQPTHQQ